MEFNENTLLRKGDGSVRILDAYDYENLCTVVQHRPSSCLLCVFPDVIAPVHIDPV